MAAIVKHNPSISTPIAEEERPLIQAFISGNNYAFSLLYKRYSNGLFAYGMAMGFERETVKDAVQEVFYKLYDRKKQLATIKNLKHYLLKMLKNYLFDQYRSQGESNLIDSHEQHFSITTTVLDELITHEEQMQLRQRVDHLLQLLTDRQREAIHLRFILEMEYEEIGELLNMTPQASRKLISRAIKRMREEDAELLLMLLVLGM
ncbi:sigma-70 family RNA polymerase sigma factor [Parabacteroides sp. OttesenSCG-928-N08]|nr:sigma-70 family RNA polymerase sigma factor [Parabacteroides sp. OttesenSCG-928-N08]